MLKYFLSLVLFPIALFAQTESEVERLNFFPKGQAFVDVAYQYKIMRIDTPATAVTSKELLNYTSTLSLSSAYKVKNPLFLGVKLHYEQASENAATYGIEASERFSSRGLREPDFFFIWRVREQKPNQGLIDLHSSYSRSMGAREVGSAGANRLNGRNILRLGLSHGLVDDEWEFRSLLELHHFFQGKEHNAITGQTYHLDTYNDTSFKFSTQYNLQKLLYLNATIGVIYRGSQSINGGESYDREIQSGSGSLFEIGVKKIISKTAVIAIRYQFYRNEYFVKGNDSNLDGGQRVQNFSVNLIQGF